MQDNELRLDEALAINQYFGGGRPMSVGEQALVRTAEHVIEQHVQEILKRKE